VVDNSESILTLDQWLGTSLAKAELPGYFSLTSALDTNRRSYTSVYLPMEHFSSDSGGSTGLGFEATLPDIHRPYRCGGIGKMLNSSANVKNLAKYAIESRGKRKDSRPLSMTGI
jgi:hypothetical protein